MYTISRDFTYYQVLENKLMTVFCVCSCLSKIINTHQNAVLLINNTKQILSKELK